ncbi:zinc-binding dehydrogenase [Myceligenerans pegani]|uniref:Zinc-binding dehydrogenase n=1 Tax=Myceligenerans pegani TaxID=2776917 RepID=A0ABR9N2F4_9MICO|nr:zinc-binding dehydrogenase [Myceligenerans sp. TRM 65318]MBE1877827.1 zinc-binding dehydrogenase [Myceligenerans sp. TRM 65318]MBE3020098.1 zinc-binding dehydrogenase [Myceligenerans sp. TRM 65318]
MEINERVHPPRRMRALVQRSHRGPEDLTLTTDRPRPTPGPGEYLVRVGAAGINFADVMRSRGTYDGGPRAPYVAGFEAAGEIVGHGPDVVDPLPLGTHVVGTGLGAFAQYMTMPVAEAFPVPSGWTDAEALGLVLNWATALAALKPLGETKAGDVVLVHAAAGGVGQAAVRLARHFGARVIATAAPAKHDTVRALGAAEVLDRSRPDLAAEIVRLSGGVDLVLESVGRATFDVSLSVTKPFTGRVVVFGAASGDAHLSTHDLVFTHPVQVKGLHIGALAAAVPSVHRSLLVELEALIAQGVYPPGTPRVHPLAEGRTVLERLEAGQTEGKQALDPWR